MPKDDPEEPVMYGRPLVGKGFLAALACGLGAVMYPACRRGRKTAGHDGLRGSGSRHCGALERRDDETEYPDPGPDLCAVAAFCSLPDHGPITSGRRVERRCRRSLAASGLSGLRTSSSAEWSWLRLLLRLWGTRRRYPQPIRPRRFCEAARSRLRPGSPRRCGRSWPPAPAPPPSPAGGRGCRAAIALRDRCAGGRCA